MAVIKCPSCGAEIEEGSKTCKKCRFDLTSDYDNGIDNSNEIDAMFAAANKKVKQDSASKQQSTTALPNSSDKLPEQPSPTQKSSSEQLSAEQINELMAGGVVDITALPDVDEPVSPEVEKATMAQAQTMAAPETNDDGAFEPELDDLGLDSIMNFGVESDLAESLPEESEEQKDEETTEAVAEKPQNKIFSIIIHIALVVVAIAVGFFACLLITGDFWKTPEQLFSEKAADALQSTLSSGQELVVIDSYSRIRSGDSECVIFGGIKTALGTMENHMYRVLVENENTSVIRIFYEFDEAQYNELKESDKSTDRIQASVLKNYADEFSRSVSEISAGAEDWVKTDSEAINKLLENKPADNSSEEAENISTLDTDDEADVEDVYE